MYISPLSVVCTVDPCWRICEPGSTCDSALLLFRGCLVTVFPCLHSSGADMFCVSARCVFMWQLLLISAPLGSLQNKQTWLPAPSVCRCGLSHSHMHASCLPHAAPGTEPQPVSHTHKHRLSQPNRKRDTTETDMSAPRAGAAFILWGKLENNSRLIDSDGCVLSGTVCVWIITLIWRNLWKTESKWFMLMFDSCGIKTTQSSVSCVFRWKLFICCFWLG